MIANASFRTALVLPLHGVPLPVSGIALPCFPTPEEAPIIA